MSLAPIILFVYNRPWHTQQTVEALQKNELATESDLFIFADGPKTDASEECLANISKVRKYILTIEGFKSITIEEAHENKGLANSVIAGVTKIINQFGKVIVVEDDIVTHPFFLRFMNDTLETYEINHKIFCVGGYQYKFKIPFWYRKTVYIVHRAETWGWATWLDRWNNVDWDINDYNKFINSPSEIKLFTRGGKDMLNLLKSQMNNAIDSWAIRWDYCMYKNDAYCVRPTASLTTNIGFDNSGTHCGYINAEELPQIYSGKYFFQFPIRIRCNRIIAKRFKLTNEGEKNVYNRLVIGIKKALKETFLH